MIEDIPLVIHLAAGQGTRLRPLTEEKPKPLVKLGGQALLDHNIETLNKVGLTDHVVVTGYRAEQIREKPLETVHNPDYENSNMVYSLFCAKNQFSTDRDLIISYGDIIYSQEVIERLLDCTAPICVVVDKNWRELWDLRFSEPLSDAEKLQIDSDGYITSLGEPADRYDEVDGHYIGLIKIGHDYIEEITDCYYNLDNILNYRERQEIDMTQFLQILLKEGHELKAVPIQGGWLEVDTYDELMKYRAMADNGELSRFIRLQ